MMKTVGRYRMHGHKIVGRVHDCESRRQDAGDDNFLERFRAACAEILARFLARPSAAVQDNRRQYDALAEINRKNAAFWKDRIQ